MPYAYCADIWCDGCADEIKRNLDELGYENTGDTDQYPQYASSDEEVDSPNHCAGNAACNEKIDLRDYGMPEDATLYGAESYYVGAIVSDRLTDEGVTYLFFTLADNDDLTPYQEALHKLWEEHYSDYLG